MDNPYAKSTALVLTETMSASAYRSLLSKNLMTTTTQFNALLSNTEKGSGGEGATATSSTADDSATTGIPAADSAAKASVIKGSYVIKTIIKSPSALLDAVDTESSLGLSAVDALASLFPPKPTKPNGKPFDPSGGKNDVSNGVGPQATEATSGDANNETDFNATNNTTYTNNTAYYDDDDEVAVARIDHADRMDIINLQERILQLLDEGNARPAGICPVRDGVYSRAMDELVRQVAVLCPERGLLLAELRKEMKETDATYDLLFDTACQYAVRKAIARDLGRTMLQEMEDMAAEVRTSENRVSELKAKYEGQQKRALETRAAAQKLHEEEVAFIKKGTQQLTQEVKRLQQQQQQQAQYQKQGQQQQ